MLAWYNDLNSRTLSWVTYSVKDSDISDFYRWIIGYKNLLRAVEFAGKAGIIGMEYLATPGLAPKQYENFLKFNSLRKEYLNQTFNFVPQLQVKYEDLIQRNTFESIQDTIASQSDIERELTRSVGYLVQFLRYSDSLRKIVQNIASRISVLVQGDIQKTSSANIAPLTMIIVLFIFVPVCITFTLHITTSMNRIAREFDHKAEIYKSEKKKTEKLLESLLPNQVIIQIQKGEAVKPKIFKEATIFFCDICSFTGIASESTADQTIALLNDLWRLFDDRIDNYEVYKVETIGDAYLVASGLPVENGRRHAAEIARMSLDLLAKVLTFQIAHKPNARLQLRMGMHSGEVVGGVVGTKIPHFSVLGDTVEMAALMESTGEPMKIQLTEATQSRLLDQGGFCVSLRGEVVLPSLGPVTTYWLTGHSSSSS